MPEGTSRPSSLPDALRLKLGLNDCLRLTAWGQLGHEQAATTASIKFNSVAAVIHGLRRKLSKHRIKLTNIRNFGWALHKSDRAKILALMAPKQTAKAADAKLRRRSRIEPAEQRARSAAA
jgi:hypothetical protein